MSVPQGKTPKTRTVHQWETVSVTPLPPGWFTVYDNGPDQPRFIAPCPALLLQELRVVDTCRDVPQPDGTMAVDVKTRKCAPPYETRVEFGAYDTSPYSDFFAATELSNYLGPLAPGQDAEGIYPYERPHTIPQPSGTK